MSTPALDYEAVKDVFYAKLERDRHGHGRMESALFHTAQWIFLQGCQERDKLLARIAEQDADLNTLRCAMQAHGEQAASLIAQIEELQISVNTLPGELMEIGADVAALITAARGVVDRWDSPHWKDLPHTGESIAVLRAALEKAEA